MSNSFVPHPQTSDRAGHEVSRAPPRETLYSQPVTDFENTSVAAILAQRSRETRDELLDELVVMLATIVPSVQIERSLLRRRVTAVRIPLGAHVYVLKKDARGSFEPMRVQEVRGVAIRTTPMEIDAFLAELGTAIDVELRRTEKGRLALQSWLRSLNP